MSISYSVFRTRRGSFCDLQFTSCTLLLRSASLNSAALCLLDSAAFYCALACSVGSSVFSGFQCGSAWLRRCAWFSFFVNAHILLLSAFLFFGDVLIIVAAMLSACGLHPAISLCIFRVASSHRVSNSKAGLRRHREARLPGRVEDRKARTVLCKC